jgi:putative nucleotidyltransferase with HDIG domain
MNETLTLSRAIGDLPVLSPVVNRIAQVVSNPESSVDAVVDALKLDPVISGKVLKLANSAYVGIPRTISSVKNAVVLLGLKRINSLVLATSVLSHFRDNDKLPFSLFCYWQHSGTVAMIAESVARHLKRYDPIDADDVFSAGLLHDIGKLVLATSTPKLFEQSVEECLTKKKPFFEVEKTAENHCRAGSLLCTHWNLPDALASAVAYHHDPAHAQQNRRIVSIVHIADILAHIIGFSTIEQEPTPPLIDVAINEVKLPPERLRVIADEALQNEKKVESFINFLI